MTFGPLIDPDALAPLIERGAVLVCDCRFDLADAVAGRRVYADGHIPGAIHVDLETDLSALPNGRNGRHPLPDRSAFAARVASLGVRADVPVVGYDVSGGFYASRLWWMLRWIGHERVAVLDGGLAAWTASGRPLQAGVERVSSGDPIAIDVPRMPTSDVAQIEANLREPEWLVVDARTAERFAGAPHLLDTVSGHIPGARNRFFGQNLAADGRFKPADQLAREYLDLLAGVTPAQLVHQCGSGVTATHNLLAMEVAGLTGSRLYPGSWSEWTSDPSRPIATGTA